MAKWIDKFFGLGGRDSEVVDEPKIECATRWDGLGQLPLTKKEWMSALTSTSTHAENIKNSKSFTDLIKAQYELSDGTIGLSDLKSFGVCFEVEPVVTEARSEAYMKNLLGKIEGILRDSIPKDAQSPWMLQMTLQDEEDFTGFKETVNAYPKDKKGKTDIKDSAFTKEWLRILNDHLDDVSTPSGLFDDKAVTGGIWRGKYRKVRLYLWRIKPDVKKDYGEELDLVIEQVINRFKASDIQIKKLPTRALYEWLSHFFVPNGKEVLGRDIKDILRTGPSEVDPGLKDLGLFSDSVGGDFARSTLHGTRPYSDESGVWYLTGKPTKFISVEEITQVPSIGALTAELENGDQKYALWDKMPQGAIWSMTIIFEPEDMIEAELDELEKATLGESERSKLILSQISQARHNIADGNPIFKAFMGVYVQADTDSELDSLARKATSWLDSAGFKMISPAMDLIAQDCFIRALPFNFEPEHDAQPAIRRARKWFANHLARIAPFYGRARGTGNPGFLFFNRGAEPLTFDPLVDKVKNAFMLILGPTGSGKSALLNYIICQYMAFYRPRFFVIEKGKSFYLLGQFLQRFGVSVNQITITPNSPVSLNPYNDAYKLPEVQEANALSEDGFIDPIEEADQQEDDQRDELGEMLIAAITMITGGEEDELSRLRRHEKYQIQLAIIEAGKQSIERGYTLTEDVANALEAMSKDMEYSENHRERLREFSEAMQLFTTGVRGQFFNRQGDIWPDCDITIFDIGMMSGDSYSDMLGVSMVSMLNKIISIAEANQNTGRPIITLADEGHLTTTNPLISPIITNMNKMARKLNLWFWLATQNLADFKDASAKMLSNMEWWITMSTTADEVQQISRFKDLSDDQKSLLLAARKEKGKYTEGVVMSDKLLSLFRNVPPAISMALAQTDPDEKEARRDLMLERGITNELDAALIIAELMADSRREFKEAS